MGHMTHIANALHSSVESRQEVAQHVQHSRQWQDYMTVHLQPRNEVTPSLHHRLVLCPFVILALQCSIAGSTAHMRLPAGKAMHGLVFCLVPAAMCGIVHIIDVET